VTETTVRPAQEKADPPPVDDRMAVALQRSAINPQALMEQALTNNVGVEVMERLVALAERVQGDIARRAWYDAMAQFQHDCEPITKNETASIRTSGGSYSYSYATLDEITGKVMAAMGPLGLSISYRLKYEAQRVAGVCRVSHSLGHFEESGEVSIPVETGSMGANSAQRIGIAAAYVKRYALLAITGLAPEKDESQPPSATVREPQRVSEQRPPSDGEVGNVWLGTVTVLPETKTGTSKNGPWTMWTVRGHDGTEFITFSRTDSEFARTAGNSAVEVTWELTQRKSKMIVSIQPASDGPRG
jgi:ERF superfamily protein